jgi:hypothetical protein
LTSALVLVAALLCWNCERESSSPQPREPAVAKEISLDRSTFGIPEGEAEWPLVAATELEFKGWRIFRGPYTVKVLEDRLQFRFPREFVELCAKHDGGVLAGYLVFNAPECRGLRTYQLLGFGDPTPGYESFNNDIIAVAISANSCFTTGAFSSYIPFARVDGSVAWDERLNPWNAAGFLAFRKSDGSVHLVSTSLGKATQVARDFASFMRNSAYVCAD